MHFRHSARSEHSGRSRRIQKTITCPATTQVTATPQEVGEFLCQAARQRSLISETTAADPSLLVEDSLVPLPWLCDTKLCIDLGTGGGVPGLILAAALPKTEFVLIDRRQRSADFVNYATTELALANTTTLCGSLSDASPDWQAMLCRGISEPWKLADKPSHRPAAAASDASEPNPTKQIIYWGRDKEPASSGWQAIASLPLYRWSNT